MPSTCEDQLVLVVDSAFVLIKCYLASSVTNFLVDMNEQGLVQCVLLSCDWEAKVCQGYTCELNI